MNVMLNSLCNYTKLLANPEICLKICHQIKPYSICITAAYNISLCDYGTHKKVNDQFSLIIIILNKPKKKMQ